MISSLFSTAKNFWRLLEIRKVIIVILIIGYMGQVALAQQQEPAPEDAAPPALRVKPPVMRSVFWNTLLGSAWGAIMGSAASLADKSADFRESLILGTTIGGVMGYGFGIVLVMRGYSFDSSIIPDSPLPRLGPRRPVGANSDLFLDDPTRSVLAQQFSDSSTESPKWIWKATLNIRF